MNTPNDCIVVKLKTPGYGTHCQTWRIAGTEIKNIPIDIYNQISEKLVVVDDPHKLLPDTKSEEPELEEDITPTEPYIFKKVKKRGGKKSKK